MEELVNIVLTHSSKMTSMNDFNTTVTLNHRQTCTDLNIKG